MEIIDSTSTQGNVILPVNHAGFLLRGIAYIIDRFIVGFLSFAVIFPLLAILGISAYGMRSFADLENFESMDDGAKIALVLGLIAAYSTLIIISVTISWLYYALMESSQRQATLGKSALGIKVTDLNGNRISFLNATGRYFGKILSGLIFGIGYIMIIFTEKKQGLHDVLAGTLVVRK
ncbi:MAG: RDD family protein [Chitinophagaceae bacterium]|nr:RDD family protein [Chitinophagaceae bacterium]